MLSIEHTDWLFDLPLARLPQLEHHSAWEQLHALDFVIQMYHNNKGGSRTLTLRFLEQSIRILQQTVLPKLETIVITLQFDSIAACSALAAAANAPRLCGDLEKAISWVRRQAIMVASSRGIRATRKPLWLSRAASLFPAMQARNSLFIKGPWSA